MTESSKQRERGRSRLQVSVDREELVRRSFDVAAAVGIGLFSPSADALPLEPPPGAIPDSSRKEF